MSKQVGQLLTCDRCGKTEFLPYIGKDEFDGGYPDVIYFKKPSEFWVFAEDLDDCSAGRHNYVDLCPNCRKEYVQVKKNFFNMKGELAND